MLRNWNKSFYQQKLFFQVPAGITTQDTLKLFLSILFKKKKSAGKMLGEFLL